MARLRADLHTHSHYSRDSVLSPEAYVDACVRKGITCAAVTDHNEVRGAFVIQELALRQAQGELKVIVGEEVKTAEGEIVGLFLKELVPNGMSAEDTIRAIKEQGGVVIIPHPFDVFRRNVIKPETLERVIDKVDAVEGYNCRNILARHDAKARELAARAGKPVSVASDAHSRWEIGGVYIEMDGFENTEDFLRALAGGVVRFRRSLPMVHWISTYAKIRWRLGLRPHFTSQPLDGPVPPGLGARGPTGPDAKAQATTATKPE